MSRTIAIVHFMCIGQDQVEVIFYILIILEIKYPMIITSA